MISRHLAAVLFSVAAAIIDFIVGRILNFIPLYESVLLGVAIVAIATVLWVSGNQDTTPRSIESKIAGIYEGEFAASIDKTSYRLGDVIVFHVRFKGYLKNGCFCAGVQSPKELKWTFDNVTMNVWGTRGHLEGNVERSGSWTWQIPTNWTPGRYTINVGVCEKKFLRNILVLEFFNRLTRINLESRGFYDSNRTRRFLEFLPIVRPPSSRPSTA